MEQIEPQSVEPQVEEESQQPPPEPVFVPAKILIVEDMPTTRALVSGGLQVHGYKTACAKSGEEAVMWLDFNTPDLIVLDLQMPQMDGFTLLKTMQKYPRLRDIPIIALTGSADRHSVSRANELKVNKYLLKDNYNIEVLVSYIKEELEKAKPKVRIINRMFTTRKKPQSKGIRIPKRAAPKAAEVNQAKSKNSQQYHTRNSR